MTRIEYIENIKGRLFELFPNLTELYYAYDNSSDTHFIFIPSISVFSSDEFVKFSTEISLSYYDSSFGGSLAFISDIDHMEYLEFHIYKNYYLVASDLINESIQYPVIFDKSEVFSMLCHESNMFAFQDLYDLDYSGESYYALAA